MNFHFNYPNEFISEEMAIAFLKSKSIELKDGERIYSVQIQVHKSFEHYPLRITFQISYQGGGKFHYFNFLDYFAWFEINKSKYIL